jgi:hypothetical protein
VGQALPRFFFFFPDSIRTSFTALLTVWDGFCDRDSWAAIGICPAVRSPVTIKKVVAIAVVTRMRTRYGVIAQPTRQT